MLFRNLPRPTLFITLLASLCFSFCLLQRLYRFIPLLGLIFYQCSGNASEASLPGQAVTIAFRCWDPLSTEQTGLSKLLDCWHFANVTSRAVEHSMMGQAWWSITREHMHAHKKKINHLQQRLIKAVGLQKARTADSWSTEEYLQTSAAPGYNDFLDISISSSSATDAKSPAHCSILQYRKNRSHIGKFHRVSASLLPSCHFSRIALTRCTVWPSAHILFVLFSFCPLLYYQIIHFPNYWSPLNPPENGKE